MATTRDDLHRMVDELPESALDGVIRFLQHEANVRRRLDELHANAPTDDEPVTDEDLAAFAEGEADIDAGHGVLLVDLPPVPKTRRVPQRRRPVA